MLIVHAHVEHQRKCFLILDVSVDAIPPFADMFTTAFEIFDGAIELGKRLLIIARIESAALVGGAYSITPWHAVVVIVSSAEFCEVNGSVGLGIT